MVHYERYKCLSSVLTRLVRVRIFKTFTGSIAASLLLCGALSAANVYYVSSQNGNDSWSGLLASPNGPSNDGPFRSLSKAQSAMRGSSTKIVNVRGGTYSISSNLQFYSNDTGETWIAYSGETPVLDGGGSGTVIFNNPQTITFEGFTLQNLSSSGIYINFARGLTIRWNQFNNCGQYCLSGGGLYNSTIDSNTISGGATNAAIALWYGSSNNQITHNLIQNTLGGGINLATGTSDPPTNNNIVDRNRINNIAINANDAGGVYMVDTSHSVVGNQITNNVINGIGGSNYRSTITKGIYLDDSMSNVTVTGNICRNCGQFEWQIHAGDHNVFENNIFDVSQASELVGIYQTQPPGWTGDHGMNGNVFQRNIYYFGVAQGSSLYFVDTVPSDAPANTSTNLYYSAAGGNIPNGQGIVDSNPVYANPQFANPSGGNYSMPGSSPAFNAIGFQALPTDQGPVGGGPNGGTSGGGGLTGSGNSSSSIVNLTAEGPTDWAHWGLTSLTQKRSVTPQISSWSIVGSGPANYYTNDPRAVTFTDGTSPTSATANDGIYINGTNGFSFSVPAGTSSHVLTVHVGGYSSSGTFTAHLSDGSASDFVDSTGYVSGSYDRNYSLTYTAASSGQKLTITWVCNVVSGNVTLDGAALQ